MLHGSKLGDANDVVVCIVAHLALYNMETEGMHATILEEGLRQMQSNPLTSWKIKYLIVKVEYMQILQHMFSWGKCQSVRASSRMNKWHSKLHDGEPAWVFMLDKRIRAKQHVTYTAIKRQAFTLWCTYREISTSQSKLRWCYLGGRSPQHARSSKW